MDMGPGYAKSARKKNHAPQATICIGSYHAVALATKALDEVRRGYWNELRSLGDQQAAKRFKEARWSLLTNPELTTKQAATHRKLKRAGGAVWRAYTLKEALRAIFAPGLDLEDITVLIDRFISRATSSRLKPFVGLAQTITKHRDGISPRSASASPRAAPRHSTTRCTSSPAAPTGSTQPRPPSRSSSSPADP
jgi:transposase